MAAVSASVVVPGRISEAEELWYDRDRWPAWVDGFGHVVQLGEEWPRAGARLVWDSKPGGRGRVVERVTRFEERAGQTSEVEDERLRGTQTVAFAPEDDSCRVTLTLDFTLKRSDPFSALAALFTRRPLRDSLQRTLTRFRREREAVGWLP